MKFYRILFLMLGMSVGIGANAQDPNFYVFLCFGQSNMEGQGSIQSQDDMDDYRFQVLQAVDCSNLGRTKDTWYPAQPPLCRCYNGLGPADYFGRTLIENLPEHIRVGVINVAIGGSRIEIFDKDIYENYTDDYTEDWFQNAVASYDGNPYQHLVNLAQRGKAAGVIKGILLHQGESNSGQSSWPGKVKTVYDNLMADLELDPTEVPILAGEVVHTDVDGQLGAMNSIIGQLPNEIENAHIVSSSGIPHNGDRIHFSTEGIRELGTRYGETMLQLLGDPGEPLNVDKSFDKEGYYLSPSFPNPVEGVGTLSFHIPKSGHVSLKLYDMAGVEVREILASEITAGSHEIELDTKSLSTGFYLLKMQAETFSSSQKIMVK